MKSLFYKLGIPVVTAMVMSVGATQQASANALASAVVEFTDFQAFWQDSCAGTSCTDQLDAADFSTLAYTGTADVTASIDSVAGSASDDDNSSSGDPIDLYETQGTVPTYANNDFTQQSSTGGYPDGTYAIGDSFEDGAPITGLPGSDGASDPDTVADADLGNASYVNLDSADGGSATSNNGLSASIVFTADRSDEIVFEFDLDAWAEAYLDVGQVPPSFAQASWEVSLSLVELSSGVPIDELLAFSLNCSVSLNAPFSGANNGGNIDNCELNGVSLIDQQQTTATVVDGTTYQFTANIKTAADAKIAAIAIPEPSIAALMGVGFLLLGYFSRRKHRLAA